MRRNHTRLGVTSSRVKQQHEQRFGNDCVNNMKPNIMKNTKDKTCNCYYLVSIPAKTGLNLPKRCRKGSFILSQTNHATITVTYLCNYVSLIGSKLIINQMIPPLLFSEHLLIDESWAEPFIMEGCWAGTPPPSILIHFSSDTAAIGQVDSQSPLTSYKKQKLVIRWKTEIALYEVLQLLITASSNFPF